MKRYHPSTSLHLRHEAEDYHGVRATVQYAAARAAYSHLSRSNSQLRRPQVQRSEIQHLGLVVCLNFLPPEALYVVALH